MEISEIDPKEITKLKAKKTKKAGNFLTVEAFASSMVKDSALASGNPT